MLQKRSHGFFQQLRYVAVRPDLGQHQREMVRAYTRQQVGISHLFGEPLGHLPEQRVACVLAHAVVDVLEARQIDQENGQFVSAADGAAQVLGQSFKKQAAVGQPGQHVVVSEVIEPFPFLDMVDRERDLPRQFRQQRQLFLVEEVDFTRAQGKHPDCFVRYQQRQKRNGENPGRHMLLAEPQLGTLREIVEDHRLFAQDDACGHRVAGRDHIGQGQPLLYHRAQGFVHARRGHQRDLHGFAVQHAYPPHAKAARLDRDPARLPE